MTVVIDGKAAVASVVEALGSAAEKLEALGHRRPGLADCERRVSIVRSKNSGVSAVFPAGWALAR
jgi:hypothetical protein